MTQISAEPQPAIRLEGVCKSYGQTHAVDQLDLVVPRGSLCGFLGPNGAGKSTTIRMIMSIIYPDRGSLQVLGGTALSRKDRIGYLPEERGLYRKMKVVEFLQYIGKLKGCPRNTLRPCIDQWLQRIQLQEVAQKKCEELSKGMQQKIQFLAAVLHDPELIILDEPFSGLDPVNAALLNTIIKDLHAEGRTIIFSTHVLEQAEQLCDRIFLINKGHKLLDASMEHIQQQFDPRMIHLELLDPDSRPQVLESISCTTDVMDAQAIDAAGIEFRIDDRCDPFVLMRELVNQHDLRSIELKKFSLSEVFVQLVAPGSGINLPTRENVDAS